MHRRIAFVTGLLLLVAAVSASAGGDDDVRVVFDRFVAAQNAHDLAVVGDLLLDSPSFLWITRGAPVWGREAALKRFDGLYKGTWKLEPDRTEMRVTLLNDNVAQLYVPILFTIGGPGAPPQATRFLMNQTLVKTPAGWKVASILPIPAPAS
jgi:ketosteroid isomerase-like protein